MWRACRSLAEQLWGRQGSPSRACSCPRSRRPTWDSGHAVKDLADVPSGKYFALQPELVPEATAEYYEESYLKKEKLTQPNYGCKAVQVRACVPGVQID